MPRFFYWYLAHCGTEGHPKVAPDTYKGREMIIKSTPITPELLRQKGLEENYVNIGEELEELMKEGGLNER